MEACAEMMLHGNEFIDVHSALRTFLHGASVGVRVSFMAIGVQVNFAMSIVVVILQHGASDNHYRKDCQCKSFDVLKTFTHSPSREFPTKVHKFFQP